DAEARRSARLRERPRRGAPRDRARARARLTHPVSAPARCCRRQGGGAQARCTQVAHGVPRRGRAVSDVAERPGLPRGLVARSFRLHAAGLLASWATPLASWPTVAIFSA